MLGKIVLLDHLSAPSENAHSRNVQAKLRLRLQDVYTGNYVPDSTEALSGVPSTCKRCSSNVSSSNGFVSIAVTPQRHARSVSGPSGCAVMTIAGNHRPVRSSRSAPVSMGMFRSRRRQPGSRRVACASRKAAAESKAWTRQPKVLTNSERANRTASLSSTMKTVGRTFEMATTGSMERHLIWLTQHCHEVIF